MKTEIVYLGCDNPIDLILSADGAAADLTDVIRMTLSFGALLVDSDNGDTDPIQWKKEGYATGQIRIFLGAEAITAKIYSAPLVVYDPTNPEGVMWGRINIKVEEDPEAAEAES